MEKWSQVCYIKYKEIEPKLWMSYCTLFLKVDRKQLLSMLEEDQKKLTKAINDERAQMKDNIRKLHNLNPDLISMDPYVKELLIRESKIVMKEKTTGKKVTLSKIEEINSDDELNDE